METKMTDQQLEKTIEKMVEIFNAGTTNIQELAKYFFYTGKAEGFKEGLEAIRKL